MKNSATPQLPAGSVKIEFPHSAERPAARYVSGTTVREEALEHGRLIGLYWSASGQVQRENVTSRLPGLDSLTRPIHTFELVVDGQSLHNRWDWVSASERPGQKPGTVEAVVSLRHQLRPISVNVVTRLDGSPILTRWLEVTNTGASAAALSSVSPFAGVLWDTEKEYQLPGEGVADWGYTLGYMPGEEQGQEGDLTWVPLTGETLRIERNTGRTHGSPYYILRNEGSGELFFLAWAWSGNWYAEFARRPKNCLSLRLGPLGPAPLRVIAAGETVCTPEVHIGPLHSDMDGAVQAWHQHLRASVIPPRPEGKEMYTLAGRVVEEPGEWILREVDMAAEMGVEAFMVDAGWYGDKFASWPDQRGDWYEGNWLPGGMAGVREYTHSKGLLFGLWIEAETMGAKSRVAAEHPEWVLKTDDGRQAGSLVFNYGHPEAARYAEEAVLRAVRDFKLDFLKLDYNVRNLEGGQNLRDGYAEHETWRHNEVLYGIFDRILREHPNVALENCSGGGGRNDLGILSHFHYACESDFSTFPLSIRAINTMSMFLPPEAICYYHNHIWYAHQRADLDTHLRVGLFGVPIYVGFGAQGVACEGLYYDKTRRYIELHKTVCRPILANRACVYHHTPDIGVMRPAEWCVLEYGAEDRRSAYAGIFRLGRAGSPEYVFKPRGLHPDYQYAVTLDNSGTTFRAAGLALMREGIAVRLEAVNTSELLLFASCD